MSMWMAFIELGVLILIVALVLWAIRSKPKDKKP